jgi:outer membrane protein
MHLQPRPGARVLLAAALFLGVATSPVPTAPAPAPTPAPTTQTPPATPQPAAPSGPTRPLSIDEAVQLALQQNLGIQVERLNPQLQDYTIAQALSNYTPVFGGGFNWRNQDEPPTSFLSGGQGTITSESFGGNAQVEKFFKWGTDATVSWDSARQTTNNTFSSFDPYVNGNVDVVVVQPLLRGLKFDAVRQQVAVARKNREIADVSLQQTIASTTRTVKNAYWDYVYSLNSLDVARQSLALAEESLRNTRSRVEIGTLAPIDVVQAESEVASREEAVILAEASIGQSEDTLRTLIFDPKTPDFWNLHLQPIDTAPFQLQAVDVNAAVSRALGERTDIITARKELEMTDFTLKYYKNQTLPGLSLQFNYNSTAVGGSQKVFGEGAFPPPVIGSVDRHYGDVLSDIFRSKFPTWQIALNVSYPIGTSSADANLARTEISRTQSETSLRQLELQVAYQVRDTGRTLMANSKRVDATRAARVLAERRLEAEEKKFEAGMSTSFEVFQAQRDLSEAKSNELRAILDYNKSQVDFETVQIAPVNGGGSSTGTSGTTTGSTTGTTGTTTGTSNTTTGTSTGSTSPQQ